MRPSAGRAGERSGGEAALVRLERVSAGYAGRRVLHEVSLELYPGELTLLTGSNGSGKSTLARVLAGVHRPQAGVVRWGRKYRRLPLGRRVGLLFQNAASQLLMDTVSEEAAFAPGNFGMDAGRCAKAALRATGLEALGERSTASLSVGEQQRAVLAAVLAASPALLILDEPTVGQDWGHLRRLLRSLRRWARLGTAVLLISHDEKRIGGFAERILRLEGGRLLTEAPGSRDRRRQGEGVRP